MPEQSDGIFGLKSKVSRGVPNVHSVTGRNIIVATGSNNTNILGFIKKFEFTQKRDVKNRYELGLDEVSYLAPGAISEDGNTIKIEKFLVFEGNLLEAFGKAYSMGALLQGGSDQGLEGAPESLLDFNKPFDIYMLRRGIMSMTDDKIQSDLELPIPGAEYMEYKEAPTDWEKNKAFVADKLWFGTGRQRALNEETRLINQKNEEAKESKDLLKDAAKSNPYGLIIYKAFRECWFTEYSVEVDTEEGKFAPIIEKGSIKYTYMEGRPSNNPKLIHNIITASNEMGGEDIVAGTTNGPGISTPAGPGGGIGVIPRPYSKIGIQQEMPSVGTPAEAAGMDSNISQSTIDKNRQDKAKTEIDKRLDIMRLQQVELATLKLNDGDPSRISQLESSLAISDKQIYKIVVDTKIDADTLKTMMNNKKVEVGLYTDSYFGGSADKIAEVNIRNKFVEIKVVQQTVMDPIEQERIINKLENDIIILAQEGGVSRIRIIAASKSVGYFKYATYLNNYVYGEILI